jgi:hypothetical protein
MTDLKAASARLDRARAAAKVAENALTEDVIEHPYGGPDSETVVENYISREAERVRALLAFRRAAGAARTAQGANP